MNTTLKITISALLVFVFSTFSFAAQEKAAPSGNEEEMIIENAEVDEEPPTGPLGNVYFISPAPNAVVKNPFKLQFGLGGLGVAPAGVDKENTGHHHLMIDSPALPDFSKPMPNDEFFIHFGGGQTETYLELPPGKHTLQLIFGDKDHVPFSKDLISPVLSITVEK